MLCLPSLAQGNTLYRFYSDAALDGHIIKDSDPCPGAWGITPQDALIYAEIKTSAGLGDDRYFSRAFFRFDTSVLTGTVVDSAKMRLFVYSKAQGDWDTDLLFDFQDDCLGISLDGSDTTCYVSTKSTVLYDDLPGVADSITIALDPSWVNITGYTDVAVKDSMEIMVCDATQLSRAAFATSNYTGTTYDPRLYVWVRPIPEPSAIIESYCARDGDLWIVASSCPDIDSCYVEDAEETIKVGRAKSGSKGWLWRGMVSFDTSPVVACDSAVMRIQITSVDTYTAHDSIGLKFYSDQISNPPVCTDSTLFTMATVADTCIGWSHWLQAEGDTMRIRVTPDKINLGGYTDILFREESEELMCSSITNQVVFASCEGVYSPILYIYGEIAGRRSRVVSIKDTDVWLLRKKLTDVKQEGD